jgi:hypothetical protein
MKLKTFNQHINEAYDPGSESAKTLRSLGLAPDLELEERIEGMNDEWTQDPEIDRLVMALKQRTGALINKWFPLDDSKARDDYFAYQEQLADMSSFDLGVLELMFIQDYNG